MDISNEHLLQKFFFILDKDVSENENADPDDIMLYCYPPGTDRNKRLFLSGSCSAIISMAGNFTNDALDVIKLESSKIAVKRAGPVTFGFGGNSRISDSALVNQLKYIIDALTFYNGPLDAFYKKSMRQSAKQARQKFELASKDIVPMIERFYVNVLRDWPRMPRAGSSICQRHFISASQLMRQVVSFGGARHYGACVLTPDGPMVTLFDAALTECIRLRADRQRRRVSRSKPGSPLVELARVYVSREQYKTLLSASTLLQERHVRSHSSSHTTTSGSELDHRGDAPSRGWHERSRRSRGDTGQTGGVDTTTRGSSSAGAPNRHRSRSVSLSEVPPAASELYNPLASKTRPDEPVNNENSNDDMSEHSANKHDSRTTANNDDRFSSSNSSSTATSRDQSGGERFASLPAKAYREHRGSLNTIDAIKPKRPPLATAQSTRLPRPTVFIDTEKHNSINSNNADDDDDDGDDADEDDLNAEFGEAASHLLARSVSIATGVSRAHNHSMSSSLQADSPLRNMRATPRQKHLQTTRSATSTPTQTIDSTLVDATRQQMAASSSDHFERRHRLASGSADDLLASDSVRQSSSSTSSTPLVDKSSSTHSKTDNINDTTSNDVDCTDEECVSVGLWLLSYRYTSLAVVMSRDALSDDHYTRRLRQMARSRLQSLNKIVRAERIAAQNDNNANNNVNSGNFSLASSRSRDMSSSAFGSSAKHSNDQTCSSAYDCATQTTTLSHPISELSASFVETTVAHHSMFEDDPLVTQIVCRLHYGSTFSRRSEGKETHFEHRSGYNWNHDHFMSRIEEIVQRETSRQLPADALHPFLRNDPK